MRRLIEDAIESLILLLDEIDGDGDLEEEPDVETGGDNEPSLGSCGPAYDQRAWAQGSTDEREFEDEREPEEGVLYL
jgi:hypothetical protein